MKWKAAILILSCLYLCEANRFTTLEGLLPEPINGTEKGLLGPRTFIHRCLKIKRKCKFSCTLRICKRCMKCPDEDRPAKLPTWNIPPDSVEAPIRVINRQILVPYPVPVPQQPQPYPVPYPVPYPAPYPPPYPSSSCNKCRDEPQYSCNKCGESNPYPHPYPAPSPVDGPCNSCGEPYH